MSSLLVIKGPNIGVRYELGERARIGRLTDNEVPVADSNVSRVHAEIVRTRMSYAIFDQDSKNGVHVNGTPVKEKILLRNDEIQIGSTVFLFNSDLNIRNARFSDNSVYMYPPTDETLGDARKSSGLDGLTGRDRDSVEFVLRFAELFSAPPLPLAETAERLMQAVMELFSADAAVLFLVDPVSGEPRPAVALPKGGAVAVNRQLVATAAEEKHALLNSEASWWASHETGHGPALDPAAVTGDVAPPPPPPPPQAAMPRGNDTVPDFDVDSGSDPVMTRHSAISPDTAHPDGPASDAAEHPPTDPPALPAVSASPASNHDLQLPPPHADVTTMCAPVAGPEGATLAVMTVEKHRRDHYSLRDLGLLQAVAKLASGTLQAAILGDRLADRARELTRVAADAGLSPDGADRIHVPSRNARVQEMFAAARRAADTDVTVLVTGESGTGKEVLARHVHDQSRRRQGPFVAVNCGAIPGPLFESELFGHERGAFTGAVRTTAGRIEQAHGGTLFLDEVGELDPQLQPKLLRFLQDKAFHRVGGRRAMDADVRIVAATNVDLALAVRDGRFREDLWYRLNVVPFHMPPLRERREDIAPLVDALVGQFAARMGRKTLGVNDAAVNLLQRYDWPGNIRELSNAVERAVLLAEGRILGTADFAHIEEARRRQTAQTDLERKKETRPLAEVERQHIIAALKRMNWNQARTSEALGMHRNTLRNKIIEYGIEIPR